MIKSTNQIKTINEINKINQRKKKKVVKFKRKIIITLYDYEN